jgi:hypothetical protein
VPPGGLFFACVRVTAVTGVSSATCSDGVRVLTAAAGMGAPGGALCVTAPDTGAAAGASDGRAGAPSAPIRGLARSAANVSLWVPARGAAVDAGALGGRR